MKINRFNFKISNLKNNFVKFIKNFYVLLILFGIYIPLIIIVLLSFQGQTSKGNIVTTFKNKFLFTNYLLLFENKTFKSSFINSILVCVIVVPFSTIITIFTCFGIWNSKNKLSKIIFEINEMSLAIPDPIIGVGLSLLLISTILPLGFDFGFFSVCLAHISYCTPYAIIVMYPKLAKLNKNLILASYDLGYSKIKTFFNIVLPYLLPTIFLTIVVITTMSFDDFVVTNFVNGSFQTLPVAIYSTRNGIKAWVVTFGALVVISAILITFIIIFYKNKKIKKHEKLKIKKELWF